MFAQLCCKHFSVQRTEYPWNVLIYLVNKALDRSSMYTCSLLFFTPPPSVFILFVAFFLSRSILCTQGSHWRAHIDVIAQTVQLPRVR